MRIPEPSDEVRVLKPCNPPGASRAFFFASGIEVRTIIRDSSDYSPRIAPFLNFMTCYTSKI